MKKAQVEREREREALIEGNKTVFQRSKDWAQENRYPLLFGFWIASMAGSWSMVNRNRYLSGSQKLVQARMYAQGATLAALLTSFAIEGNDAAKGTGRWETIRVLDPNDPTHKNMIEKKIHHESYPGEDQWRGTLISTFLVLVVQIMRLWWGSHLATCPVSHETTMEEYRCPSRSSRNTNSATEMIEAEEERIKEREAAKNQSQQKTKKNE
jgi:hypothetical protein